MVNRVLIVASVVVFTDSETRSVDGQTVDVQVFSSIFYSPLGGTNNNSIVYDNGESQFDTGDPGHNGTQTSILFLVNRPLPFDFPVFTVEVGQPFNAGILKIYNGTSVAGSTAKGVRFALGTAIMDDEGNDIQGTIQGDDRFIRIISTINASEIPDENADIYQVAGFAKAARVREREHFRRFPPQPRRGRG